MTRHGPTDVVHYLAGFDLAGPGALVEMTPAVMAQSVPVTPLGPNGALAHGKPTGRLEYALTEAGWLRGQREASLRRLFAAALPATPWPSVTGFVGHDVGAEVTICTDLRVKSQTFAPDLDNFTRVEVEYYNHRGSALYENARLLTMATVTGSTGPGSQPAASLRVDNGAASDGGATIVLMFDPDITRFRGFPTLNMQVRGYTGSVWSDVGAAQAFARDDDPHVTLTIASGTTIPRYLALQWSVSGTRDAFQIMGSHSSGATTLDVDGGTGTERIQDGDTLRISGQDYVVESATEGTGGQWDVVLTSGLVANVANNVAVTQTGTATELRICAAVARH